MNEEEGVGNSGENIERRETTLREKGSDSVRKREGFEQECAQVSKYRATHSRKSKTHKYE